MKIGFVALHNGYSFHSLHSGKHTMNTMTNTAEFSHQTAQADHSEFFPTLLSKLLGLLRLSSGMNSIDTALLAERIVLD
jgi:hypothetical protein